MKYLREQFFKGLPDQVMNYFKFIAQDVREILASLGVESLTAIIGRTDLLVPLAGITAKQQKLDLRPIIAPVIAGEDTALHQTDTNEPFDKGELNQRLLALQLTPFAHSSGGEYRLTFKIPTALLALRYPVKLPVNMATKVWPQLRLKYFSMVLRVKVLVFGMLVA